MNKRFELQNPQFNSTTMVQEIVAVLKNPPFNQTLTLLSFEEKREYVTKLAIEYLKQKWPNTQSKVLEYKGNLSLLKDNVAIHLSDDMPELYIYLTLNGPLLFDSYRYDAYEKGPFEKQEWKSGCLQPLYVRL